MGQQLAQIKTQAAHDARNPGLWRTSAQKLAQQNTLAAAPGARQGRPAKAPAQQARHCYSSGESSAQCQPLNLTLKQLEAFVRVADLGSFRKAAERLNTTQPNISSRISSLESILQVTLMERDAGSVRLTSRGQELLQHARKVLQTTETLVEASGASDLYVGVLKLGVTEIIAHTWLRDFLKALKASFPEVVVELTVDLSANLKKELFSRSIDLTFQSGPFNRRTSGSCALGNYPLIWVAAPGLPVSNPDIISLADLARHPILTPARDTEPYREISAHLASYRAINARLVPSSSLAACLHMTIDEMGIASMPASMVSSELTNGELVKINYPWTPQDLRFLARYDADRTPGYVAAAAALAASTAASYTADESLLRFD